MNLGDAAEISLAVEDLDAAAPAFERLGFSPANTLELPYRTRAFTDGKVTLALHEAAFSSPTLTYYGADLPSVLPALHEETNSVRELQREAGRPTAVTFRAPDGLRVVLSTRRPQQSTDTPAPSRCGQFSELALPTGDLQAASSFWTEVGFASYARQQHPYPWAALNNGTLRLGLHQTQDFDRPACLYFAEDATALIDELQADGGVTIIQQHSQHVAMELPGNLLLFVFRRVEDEG